MNVLTFTTDIPLDVPGKLMYGLEVAIIGVLIVFAVLFLIMLIIYLFHAFSGKKDSDDDRPVRTPVLVPPPESISPPAPSDGVNQEELVAAIAAATAMAQEELIVVLAAAVAAHEGCDPASSRYRIRSFRRIL